MPSKRKNIKANIDVLHRIISNFEYIKDSLIEYSTDKDYNKALDYVNKMVTKLEDKRQKLPIGHRYTGTLYLKKPYTVPSESVRIKGAAFMREDLVMWTIESDDEYAQNLYYVRDVYRDKKMMVKLSREDGEAVFNGK